MPLLADHDRKWNKARRRVMILSQILSTVEQNPPPMRSPVGGSARKTQKALTHLTHLMYYPSATERAGAQVIAAANLGTTVFITETPATIALSENHRQSRSSDTDTHLYRAQEVPLPLRSATMIVDEQLGPTTLLEHVGDVFKALQANDLVAAENLIIYRSLHGIRTRLRDARIFSDPSKNILEILSTLTPPDTQVELTWSSAAESSLWQIQAVDGVTTFDMSTRTIFDILRSAMKDVFDFFGYYDRSLASGATREIQVRNFINLARVLRRLDAISRNPTLDTIFQFKVLDQAAQAHIRLFDPRVRSPPHEDIDDDRLDSEFISAAAGMRILIIIRKMTQPIRSLRCILASSFLRLLTTRTLDVYVLDQDIHIPHLSVDDIEDVRNLFELNTPHQYALERLMLRAFFSKNTLTGLPSLLPVKNEEENFDHDLLSDIVRGLDAMAEKDFQSWPDADGSIPSGSSSGSVPSSSSDGSVRSSEGSLRSSSDGTVGSGGGIPSSILGSGSAPSTSLDADRPVDSSIPTSRQGHVEEVSSGSSSDGVGAGMFTAMCNALKKSGTPVKCVAILERDQRACATTKRPCFCCHFVATHFGNSMPPTHGIILPWVPACGLPFAALQDLQTELITRLSEVAKTRGQLDTTGSASDTSSIDSTQDLLLDSLRKRDYYARPESPSE
ncbi:hypothetical protein B0H13DRAFT_2027597 [Mycena leptocephala]|nr:hypothetical protein B0H13DRAFT_2027597 [Mycena leptocephala]